MERNPEKIRLVIDTNILISSLLIDQSGTVKLLKSEVFDLYYPEDGLTEIEYYKDYIITKREKSFQKRTFDFALSFVMESVTIIPSEVYQEKMKKAYGIMKDIDEKDTPFLALALQLNLHLWSNDKHFKKQNLVKCFNTNEIAKLRQNL